MGEGRGTEIFLLRGRRKIVMEPCVWREGRGGAGRYVEKRKVQPPVNQGGLYLGMKRKGKAAFVFWDKKRIGRALIALRGSFGRSQREGTSGEMTGREKRGSFVGDWEGVYSKEEKDCKSVLELSRRKKKDIAYGGGQEQTLFWQRRDSCHILRRKETQHNGEGEQGGGKTIEILKGKRGPLPTRWKGGGASA